jgi:hypothetical protein
MADRLPHNSEAARFLRDWARRAAEDGMGGAELLRRAQAQCRRLAEEGLEQDGRTLTRLQESLAALDPDELKTHLELIAWAIETSRPHDDDIEPTD